MKYPSSYYKCPCGNPIEPSEDFCLSCFNEFENKYRPDVFHFATKGFEDGLIVIQDPNGNTQKVTPEIYQSLEDKDLVWYSCLGICDVRTPK